MSIIKAYSGSDFDARKTYERGGKSRELVADGAVDHDIWDQLTSGVSEQTRDQFVSTLGDSRLGQKEPSLSSMGSQWQALPSSNYEKSFLMGDPDGAHQVVVLRTSGRSGNEFTVSTHLADGVEHKMIGDQVFGSLNSDNIQEQIILP